MEHYGLTEGREDSNYLHGNLPNMKSCRCRTDWHKIDPVCLVQVYGKQTLFHKKQLEPMSNGLKCNKHCVLRVSLWIFPCPDGTWESSGYLFDHFTHMQKTAFTVLLYTAAYSLTIEVYGTELAQKSSLVGQGFPTFSLQLLHTCSHQ